MKLEDFKKELLKDPEFKKEYFKKDLRREIAYMIIEARIAKGITQERLAKMIGTKQSSISRIESGNYLPGLNFLDRVSKALGTSLIPPKFAFLEEKGIKTSNISFKAELPEDPSVTETLRILNQRSSSVVVSKEIYQSI